MGLQLLTYGILRKISISKLCLFKSSDVVFSKVEYIIYICVLWFIARDY